MTDREIPKYRNLLGVAAGPMRAMYSLLQTLHELPPEQLTRSCLSCDHFNEAQELCAKFNARPPARVIAFACTEYSNIDDDIPF